jgi:hypothetical protein
MRKFIPLETSYMAYGADFEEIVHFWGLLHYLLSIVTLLFKQ